MAYGHTLDEESSTLYRRLTSQPRLREITVYDADYPIEAGQQFVQAVLDIEGKDEDVTLDLTDMDWRDVSSALHEDAAEFDETVKFFLTLTPVPELLTLTLDIDNIYEDGETVNRVVEVEVPPCDAEEETQEYEEWAEAWIYPETGTGKESGDAGYFVEITKASDPAWVGREFEWGI